MRETRTIWDDVANVLSMQAWCACCDSTPTLRKFATMFTCIPTYIRIYIHTGQTWKSFPTSMRRGDAAGELPADQANSPGFSGSISNLLSSSKVTVVSGSPFYVS